MPLMLDIKNNDFSQQFDLFLKADRNNSIDVSGVVKEIIQDVKKNKNKALFEYTKRFDQLELTNQTCRVTDFEIQEAIKKCGKQTLDALYLAAERIEAFHERQIPESLMFQDETGAFLGWRWTPIASAGLYVPGGTASYPSSVLMNAIPAFVAGVKRIVMVVPCPNGILNPLVLAAAECVGITEIYKIGGAQAIGALAYGTETIEPVDIITGPGNAYVAEAKRQVFGTVGIDMIAGPSEILIVADETANPAFIACDLLSQAEHDPSAQSILITDSPALAERVKIELDQQLISLERKEIALKSWQENGAIILVENVSLDAPALVDLIAPEHLELCVQNPQELCKKIHHAGAIFLGSNTPEAIGDYIAGPNHVLPTARSARFSSGLGVHTFMKRTTILSCTEKTIKEVGSKGILLANAEGLTAHAHSIKLRQK